jgi:hypothetical protein
MPSLSALFLGGREQVVTDLTDIKPRLPTRAGLSSHAIFRLWKAALKDDETLLDEAIASVHEQMTSLDQARAEHVMSLIIRRQRDSKKAFKSMLMAIGTRKAPTETLSKEKGGRSRPRCNEHLAGRRD